MKGERKVKQPNATQQQYQEAINTSRAHQIIGLQLSEKVAKLEVENATLRAKWNAIPWDLIDALYTDHAYTVESTGENTWPYISILAWITTNQPPRAKDADKGDTQ